MAIVFNKNRIKGLANGKAEAEQYGYKFLYVRKSDSSKGLVQGYCYRVFDYNSDAIRLYPNTLSGCFITVVNFDGGTTESFVKIGF